MPISFTNYQPGTPEQVSPYANLIANAMKNYQSAISARYAQPMAEQAYQQALVNTQKSKIISQLFSQILGGDSGNQSNNMTSIDTGSPTIGNPGMGNAISNNMSGGQSNVPNDRRSLVSIANADQAASDQGLPPPSLQKGGVQNQGMNAGQPGMTYPKAALAMHLLGLGEPKIIEVPGTGKQIAVTPFGNIPVSQGLSAQEKSKSEAMGKFTGESYGEAMNTYSGLQNQGTALDNLISGIDNPDFYKVAGPVGSFLTKWAGSPQQQQLLGNLQSSSGEIALQIAPSLKGSFTGKDQVMINGIKANPTTDFPDIFIGKLKAQKLINSVLSDREYKYASNVENGMSPSQAMYKAVQETPLDKYRAQVYKLIEGKPDTVITVINRKTGEEQSITRAEAKRRGIGNARQ